MQIEIRNLKKSYGHHGSRPALDGISLTIGNGMYGLLGRNGAGKTTLLRIMATLLRPSEGEITFDGVPLEETGRVRSLIGYLPQEFSFYPDMSVEEILRYLAALSELPAGIQRERIPRLLRQVNLWEDRGRKVRRLSGGMKRRLGIAQALLGDPKVLLVDEPTVGLDPEERLRFYRLLDEFSGDRAVILSSHIVADIESVCENVAVLEAGRLLYAGTAGDLAGRAGGKVFELAVPNAEAAAVKGEYYVLSSHGRLSDVKIRVLCDRAPGVHCPVPCAPTVEDGYMELLRSSGKGAGI